MTEQCKFAYAKTLQNTLTETHILRIAHNIMQLNKSLPNVAEEHIKNIRQNIARNKTNVFKITVNKADNLARLAAHAARITRENKVGA